MCAPISTAATPTSPRRDYDRAIADFGQAIRLEPKNVTIVMSRATAYEAKGDFGRAIADYDQALKLDPNLTAAYDQPRHRLAPQAATSTAPSPTSIRRSGSTRRTSPPTTTAPWRWPTRRDFDRAIADYDQAIKLDPKYALAYLNRGLLWQAKKDHDRAIADFDQAIRLAPDNAAAGNARGLIFDLKGEFDRAIADFDRAIALEPKNPTYYNNRGNVWRDRGRFDRAVEDYDKAIELSPSFAFAFYNRSQAHYLAGRFHRGAGRRRQGRRAQREFGRGVQPAWADPREARRAGCRHRRSAAGRVARSGLLAGGRCVAADGRAAVIGWSLKCRP